MTMLQFEVDVEVREGLSRAFRATRSSGHSLRTIFVVLISCRSAKKN